MIVLKEGSPKCLIVAQLAQIALAIIDKLIHKCCRRVCRRPLVDFAYPVKRIVLVLGFEAVTVGDIQEPAIAVIRVG